MENCLDENEVAQYVDYVILGAEMPSVEVTEHVVNCLHCKLEIMEICDLQYLANSFFT